MPWAFIYFFHVDHKLNRLISQLVISTLAHLLPIPSSKHTEDPMPKQPPLIQYIEKRILNIRGVPVMLDSDLAQVYGVSTSRLNEQVRRNRGRFPED